MYADKKDILKRMKKIKEILALSKNIQIIHGLFLYYILFYERVFNEEVFNDILYSSNRDFRIRLQDKKEFEKVFQDIYDNAFKKYA